MSAPARPQIEYPDRDGNPMSDNTVQFEWISLFKWEFEALVADQPDVFVAGDLLWYPVEGRPDLRMAPDTLVVFGRPRGHRGSYRQWEENGVPPQIVVEILSPGNRLGEMGRKFDFYDRYGVEEYYVYNPDDFDFSGWHRSVEEDRLRLIHPIDGWVSPRLGIRFDAPGDREMIVYRPDGQPFRSPLAVRQELERTRSERDRLAAKLRELGIDPETT